MAAPLTGSSQAVPIGEGYAIRAPGVTGVADLQRPSSPETRARSRSPRDGTTALDDAFRGTNVIETREVEVVVQSAPPRPSASRAGGAAEAPTMELQVPDLGPEVGQLVLSADEAGTLRWHLPIDDLERVQTPASRGSGGVKRFLIPATRPAVPTADAAASRGLTTLIGRKLLKVLVYPVLDPVIGLISDAFAEAWERRYRPYGLRTFPLDAFRQHPGTPLGSAEWGLLSGGRSLLFLHGTFSNAHGAFSLIDDASFTQLSDLYQGRIFALNHFTLSHDPKQNVAWLLEQLRIADRRLDVDIICHSRGGLVARTLAEQPSVFGLDTSRVKVGRVVFVAAPNGGTMLADPEHMVGMIDRITSALNLFPTGPVTETLESIITAVKVIGHGALKGLAGLASMQPRGAFLTALNSGTPDGSGYYAIAANYEPNDQGLKQLLAGGLNGVIDRVFGETGNDLVVPEPGVYGENGSAAFPIPEDRILRIAADAGIIHTKYFGHGAAAAKLAAWLSADRTA